jgi:hypothetical protein
VSILPGLSRMIAGIAGNYPHAAGMARIIALKDTFRD